LFLPHRMRLGFHSSRTDDGADLNEQKFSTSVFEVEIFSTPDDAAVSQRLPDIVIYLSVVQKIEAGNRYRLR
jgi:hypothetical protein